MTLRAGIPEKIVKEYLHIYVYLCNSSFSIMVFVLELVYHLLRNYSENTFLFHFELRGTFMYFIVPATHTVNLLTQTLTYIH